MFTRIEDTSDVPSRDKWGLQHWHEQEIIKPGQPQGSSYIRLIIPVFLVKGQYFKPHYQHTDYYIR